MKDNKRVVSGEVYAEVENQRGKFSSSQSEMQWEHLQE